MIGQTVSHYRILEKLGEGGMGVVYKARDSRLDRVVAIKVLPSEAVADSDRKQRFIQEARAASALNHPNIITVHDIDSDNGVDFIVMECLPGRTLDQVIKRQGIPLKEAIHYATQIAGALAKAHESGIVHRDLKPSNIMVMDDRSVKVLDFGLAKLSKRIAPEDETITARTTEGALLGTIAYMSPEQAQGRPVDARSDIFSFGSVFYEMLTGRRAFRGGTPMLTISALLSAEPQLTEGLPDEVNRLIRRCLRKNPEQRFQHMADLRVALMECGDEIESGKVLGVGPQKRLWWPAVALGLASLAAVSALWLWRGRTPKSQPPLVLKRMTTDSGLTTNPALSPDGKLLAYASDRSGEGNLDIWVQQTAGGAPIRLTRNEADDNQPTFSPDGSMIAFRSERDGGGVYVVSALGGEERLIARRGFCPRFSPDGGEIAYYEGNLGDLFNRNTGKIYVVASSGGASRQLQSNFLAARFPVWSPDGKHILFIGTEETSKTGELWDWYVAPVNGGPAVKTGAFQAISKQKLLNSRFVPPVVWVPQNNRVLFASGLGDSVNLWQLQIADQTWVIRDAPQRVTSGTGVEIQPSVAGSQLAFTILTESANIWILPIDSANNESHGVIKRSTEGLSVDIVDDISADGKKAVFNSNRMGHPAIWIKELDSGKETLLSARGQTTGMARITSNGSRVGFSVISGQQFPLYVVPASGGIAEKVCEDCRYWNWSSDGKKILHVWDNPRTKVPEILMLDTDSRRDVSVVQNPEFNLYMPSFSPDESWISLIARTPRSVAQQYIVPFRGKQSTPVTEWIELGEGGTPQWSPDGNSVYFGSVRDGFKCLWWQHLEPGSKRPVGAPISIQHFHRARASLVFFAVARDKLALSISESTGNIWMTNLDGP